MKLDDQSLDKLNRTLNHLYPNVLSFAIMKDSKVIYEQYYRQSSREDIRGVASVSKSILSAIFGIAIAQGLIKDENERVLDFFPECLNADSDPNILRLRIKHLLTMTSGIYYLRLAADSQPLVERRKKSENWIWYMLNLPIKHPDLKTFCYSNFDADLCAAILHKCVKMDLYDYANQYLFTPLDMKVPRWKYEDPNGLIPETFQMNTLDMLKIGDLFLQEGTWKQREIISKEWIKKATTDYGNHYGYFWWIDKNMYFASGAGGSCILVWPHEKVVMAAQCKHLKTNWKSPIVAVKENLMESIT